MYSQISLPHAQEIMNKMDVRGHVLSGSKWEKQHYYHVETTWWSQQNHISTPHIVLHL